MIAALALIAGLVTGYAIGWTLGFRAAWDGKSRRAASGEDASNQRAGRARSEESDTNGS